tara:strand:- start:1209 stop:1547 length:339 start_codon:yes stop_codon:yes gene_type:complete
MKTYKTTIKDVEWVFKLLTKSQYEALHGADSSGITISTTSEVHYLKDDLSRQVVGHELFHAYCATCGVHSTNNLSGSDMEEIGADICGFHLEDMVAKKRAIYKALAPKEKNE